MPIDLTEATRRLTTLARAVDLGAALFDAAGKRLMMAEDLPGCALCRAVCASKSGLRRCAEFHADAGLAAWQSGWAHIARCHAGVAAITVALAGNGKRTGAAALLPFRLSSEGAAFETALRRSEAELSLEAGALTAVCAGVPALGPDRAEALAALLGEVMAAESEPPAFRRALGDQQKRLDALLRPRGQDEPASARPHDYPIQLEREMLGRVRLGDKSGARAMLNELLAHIFLRSPGNMELIKARLLELVVMISRAAVESGAELDRLLGLNYNFISEAARIDDFEALSAWIVKVLDAFLETVYESRGLTGSRQLTDALSYIRSHHMQNLTLEDVAAQVYVSPYYLSHMFKEKLGVTFVEYLTRVRVDMAKSYLLNTQLPVAAIAERVGYEDASYFGKVFRRLTGVTPKGFRRGE